MEKYQYIIFDLDNTLVDDKENIKYAFYALLKYLRKEVNEKEFERFYSIDCKYWKDRAEGKIKEPYIFKDKDEKAQWNRAQRFLIYFEHKISLEEAIKFNDIYMENLKNNIIPIQGANETIKYLYQRKYKIFIATNGPKIAIKPKLDKIGIRNYITEIITSEEVGYMKPKKEFFREMIEKFNINNKEKMILIGDELEKDIKMRSR